MKNILFTCITVDSLSIFTPSFKWNQFLKQEVFEHFISGPEESPAEAVIHRDLLLVDMPQSGLKKSKIV